MTVFSGLTSTFTPSSRYLQSNPLRREAGLRLLTDTWPAALRLPLLRAFRRPALLPEEPTPAAVQSVHGQRPEESLLTRAKPQTLCWLILTELEVTRRVLEAPRERISRMTRSSLLVAQGTYLRLLYAALSNRVGEAAAQAEFERLLAKVG
jgi:hypothetical protein